MKNRLTVPVALTFFLAVLGTSISSYAKEVPFTQEDRDRLIRLEEKIDVFEKRFEDINKRFEDIHKQLNRITAFFTVLVIAVIGFAIWDRRTMIRPFEKKVKYIEDEIAGNREKLDALISAVREIGKRNKEVAEILRKYDLM